MTECFWVMCDPFDANIKNSRFVNTRLLRLYVLKSFTIYKEEKIY